VTASFNNMIKWMLDYGVVSTTAWMEKLCIWWNVCFESLS